MLASTGSRRIARKLRRHNSRLKCSAGGKFQAEYSLTPPPTEMMPLASNVQPDNRLVIEPDLGGGDDLQQQANILLADYGSTEYALLAHLALARMHVDNGDFNEAEAALQQVIGSAAQEPLAYVARTRLAAVQIQTEQYDQAITTLAVDFPEQFSALVDELRGDALASQGKTAEAVAAYRKAQNAEPQPANLEFLRQKLNDLGSRS